MELPMVIKTNYSIIGSCSKEIKTKVVLYQQIHTLQKKYSNYHLSFSAFVEISFLRLLEGQLLRPVESTLFCIALIWSGGHSRQVFVTFPFCPGAKSRTQLLKE